MNQQHYFPLLYGTVDCARCEAEDCQSRDKHQRNRRDLSYTSGRCPRLPDQRGFVEREEREAYAAAFPLVHAEIGLGGLQLSLSIPGQKRYRKVYRTKSGYWYFNSRNEEGDPIKEALDLRSFNSTTEIMQYMELQHTDYIVIRCELAGFMI